MLKIIFLIKYSKESIKGENMENKKYKIFSIITLVVLGIYAALNIFAVGYCFYMWNKEVTDSIFDGIIVAIQVIDIYSVFILPIFSVLTFLKKVFYLKKQTTVRDKKHIIDIILHILFSVLSFGGIVFIIINSF